MTEELSLVADDAPEDVEIVTVEMDVDNELAVREVENAVRGRRAMARKYVRRLRRRHPEATPGELVTMLERHYLTAISTAGAAMVALDIGLMLVPIARGTKVAKTVAPRAAKLTLKVAGKRAAKSAATAGVKQASTLLPAGEEQFQFEITALFALALADIHGLELDEQESRALVLDLSTPAVPPSNSRQVSVPDANGGEPDNKSLGKKIAEGRDDWSHWGTTLAGALPTGQVQNLAQGTKGEELEQIRASLGTKRKAALEYGVGAFVGGATRFVFGREVVAASKRTFKSPPDSFPTYLDVPAKSITLDAEPSRALRALEDAAKAIGTGVGSGASTVGSSVGAAADSVSRPFRSVDRDGDGIPDEPQALSAIKGVGTAAGAVARPFRSVDRDGDGVPDEPQALSALKGLGSNLRSSVESKRPRRRTKDSDDDTDAPTVAAEGDEV